MLNRKRIIITCDYIWYRNEKLDYKGVMGYYYFDSGFKWVETDDGKKLILRNDEFEFVEPLSEIRDSILKDIGIY